MKIIYLILLCGISCLSYSQNDTSASRRYDKSHISNDVFDLSAERQLNPNLKKPISDEAPVEKKIKFENRKVNGRKKITR